MPTTNKQTVSTQKKEKLPWVPYFLSGPLVVVLIVIMVIPLVALLMYSFYKYDALLVVTRTFTLENYEKFFTGGRYIGITLNTLWYALLVTFLTLVLSFPISYWMARYVVKGREFYLGLVVLPIALNNAVIGFGWTALLGQSGMINRIMMGLGFTSNPIQLMYNIPAVIIVLTEILMPYMILTLLSSISQIDLHLEEAAANLGAPFLVVISRVVFPLCLPGILAGSIFVFLGATTAFVIPRIIGGGGIQILGTVIYQQVTMVVNIPFAAVVSIVLTIVAFIFYLFANRLLRLRYFESLRGRQ